MAFVIAQGLGLAASAAAQNGDGETPADNDLLVLLETNFGNITLKLLPEKSPIAAKRFLRYVDDGFYDNTVFHRVMPRGLDVIQGGGFDRDLVQKPTLGTIANESANRLHHIRGTVAMARTSEPDSASAQFFINQRNNFSLDWAPGKPGYTIFAEVVDGMSVVDFIATSKTKTAMVTTSAGRTRFSDVPLEPVFIKQASRIGSP